MLRISVHVRLCPFGCGPPVVETCFGWRSRLQFRVEVVCVKRLELLFLLPPPGAAGAGTVAAGSGGGGGGGGGWWQRRRRLCWCLW